MFLQRITIYVDTCTYIFHVRIQDWADEPLFFWFSALKTVYKTNCTKGYYSKYAHSLIFTARSRQSRPNRLLMRP